MTEQKITYWSTSVSAELYWEKPRDAAGPNCRDVRITGLTLQNGASWNVHMIYSRNIVTDHCVFRSEGVWNGDGWDPDSSEDCTLFACRFFTGDDAVAIKSNKGSKTAGVDGVSMDRYLQMPRDELITLIQSTAANYKPKPARRVYIPKSNGKRRPLGIPTVLDRIVQECVRIILEPICEARFYPHSYGFRPYRAQKHAIRDIVNVINAGCKSSDRAVWAVEGDIKGCFDNINHRVLLQKLWRIGIHDKRVLKLISQMLKVGYIESGLFYTTKAGTPQGGILSPLLSNVYLNDFDWYVGRTYMEPHRQCKHKCNDTRRLKWAGVTPWS